MWLSRIVRWLAVLGDFILPQHPDVERAHRVTEKDLLLRIHPKEIGHASWITALLPYHDPDVRAMIKSIKYYADTKSAQKIARVIAPYVMDTLSEKNSFAGWDDIVLIPIPSPNRRRRERGYTQTEFITRALADEIGIPIDTTILTREDRPSQARIQKSERKNNISLAFHSADSAHGKCIVLIDDVIESGATLSDARRALLNAGARAVIAFAIAH